jgi:hypothetical protein
MYDTWFKSFLNETYIWVRSRIFSPQESPVRRMAPPP